MSRYSRRNQRDLLEIVSKLLIFLGLLAYAPVVKWWNSIPVNIRFIPVALITIIVLSAIGLLVTFSLYRKRRRAQVWKAAMIAWQQNPQGDAIIKHESARLLRDDELEEFAARVYSKMGYQARRTGQSGDHGIDVLLTNPKRETEIVQCKQWRKSVGEAQVRDLFGAMAHTKAVRGWLWAPTGFSNAARQWAKGKPIVLVDDAEIGRLLEVAYGNNK